MVEHVDSNGQSVRCGYELRNPEHSLFDRIETFGFGADHSINPIIKKIDLDGRHSVASLVEKIEQLVAAKW